MVPMIETRSALPLSTEGTKEVFLLIFLFFAQITGDGSTDQNDR